MRRGESTRNPQRLQLILFAARLGMFSAAHEKTRREDGLVRSFPETPLLDAYAQCANSVSAVGSCDVAEPPVAGFHQG